MARGTAAMDKETRTEVARKGGLTVSRDKKHMSEIGKKGGNAVVRKYGPEHMEKIGTVGGSRSKAARK